VSIVSRRTYVLSPAWATDERVLLAAIAALAILVRFVAIGSNLSNDDGYSYLVGSAPSVGAFLKQLAASENTPPLFYLLLTPLPIDHPTWLRMPAAIPGVLEVIALYFALRRPLGARVALIAALGVAVAPLLVTYANLARGFMLEDLALVVALLAILRLAAEDARAAWWWVYFVAGVVAIYTEYDAAICLVAMAATALWLGKPDRRRLAPVGSLSLLTIVPWIPEIVRAQNQVNVTKIAPAFPAPSLHSLRDLAVTLALGENGGTNSAAGRWLEFICIVALGGATAIVLRRGWAARSPGARYAIVLIAGTGTLTLIGHAIAPAVGLEVFDQRYLTILIPLAAALGAAALVAAGRRSLIVAVAVVLVAAGLVDTAKRYHHEWEPSLASVRAAALALHPKTVLTNNPVVIYYLRPLRPVLDRPFNLGPGLAQSCARPCLIIDDSRVFGGPVRQVSGTRTTIGPFVLTLEP
jgi:hypothetical protein